MQFKSENGRERNRQCWCRTAANPAASGPGAVIATLNLNGDYLSGALAAEVGGIACSGANLSDTIAMFRNARHLVHGRDQGEPGSLILSAEMILRHMGWTEAADLIIGAPALPSAGTVTYDFERLMDVLNCCHARNSEDALISHMYQLHKIAISDF
jgi:isocitrate dehydrogenase